MPCRESEGGDWKRIAVHIEEYTVNAQENKRRRNKCKHVLKRILFSILRIIYHPDKRKNHLPLPNHCPLAARSHSTCFFGDNPDLSISF